MSTMDRMTTRLSLSGSYSGNNGSLFNSSSSGGNQQSSLGNNTTSSIATPHSNKEQNEKRALQRKVASLEEELRTYRDIKATLESSFEKRMTDVLAERDDLRGRLERQPTRTLSPSSSSSSLQPQQQTPQQVPSITHASPDPSEALKEAPPTPPLASIHRAQSLVHNPSRRSLDLTRGHLSIQLSAMGKHSTTGSFPGMGNNGMAHPIPSTALQHQSIGGSQQQSLQQKLPTPPQSPMSTSSGSGTTGSVSAPPPLLAIPTAPMGENTSAMARKMTELEIQLRYKMQQCDKLNEQLRQVGFDQVTLIKTKDRFIADLQKQLTELTQERELAAARAKQETDDLAARVARARSAQKEEAAMRRADKAEAEARIAELKAEIDKVNSANPNAMPSQKLLLVRLEEMQRQLVSSRREVSGLYTRLAQTAKPQQQTTTTTTAAATSEDGVSPRLAESQQGMEDKLAAVKEASEALKQDIQRFGSSLAIETARLKQVEKLLATGAGVDATTSSEPSSGVRGSMDEVSAQVVEEIIKPDTLEKRMMDFKAAVTSMSEAVKTAKTETKNLLASLKSSNSSSSLRSSQPTLPQATVPSSISSSVNDMPPPSVIPTARRGSVSTVLSASANGMKRVSTDDDIAMLAMLESTTRRLTDALGSVDHNHKLLELQSQVLKKEISDSKAVQSGTNLMYLRNVLIKFLESDDKKTLFHIIAEVFSFSQVEKERILSKVSFTIPKK